MTRFWLVRHAPTHAKAAIGWTDIPADLSDSAALARLDAYLPRPAEIISSDLSRAAATARALEAGRVRRVDEPCLREVHFGAWEGLGFDEIAARDPAASKAFWQAEGATRAPGGESLADVVQRVGKVLDAPREADEDIVLVCHMGAILAALAHATSAPLPQVLQFVIAPLSVTRLTRLSPGSWRIEGVNHVL